MRSASLQLAVCSRRTNVKPPSAHPQLPTVHFLFFLCVSVFILVFCSRSGADDAKISALIAQLGADDSAARHAAADKLVALGATARPSVLAATHSDDPETSNEAAAVLLKLPWSAPNDPPEVRDILDHYGADPAGVDARKADVQKLAALPDNEGCDAMLRLVYEDPSDAVRWTAVHELRTADFQPRLAKLRLVDPPPDDAPLTALCGLAWLACDSSKAEPLLSQAVQGAFNRPSDDDGELDLIIGSLVDLEESDRHYDVAASLLRTELTRSPPVDKQNVPLPLPRLFALHADHGPLAGFDDDVKLAAGFLQTPKLQYALARIDLQRGQKDRAAAQQKAAFNVDADSRLGRFQTGKFLADQGWIDEAEAEFKAYLAMPPGDDQDDDEASEVNAHFELSSLATLREDWQEAAEQKKTAMSILGGGTNAELIKSDGFGHSWTASEDEIWAEVDWLYLKAALQQKDSTAIDQHLQELLKLAPTDEDIAIDVVPVLKERKRFDDARRLYAGAHQAAQAKLDSDPTNAGLMNGLAWLEAKCDENLDDAQKLAAAAVNAVPDNSAAIDTLAEVNFHLGRYARAVELEERALKLDPDDAFMTGQLARFKAAVQKSSR
jgi:tetratricopeptide (TPR) repeat protein